MEGGIDIEIYQNFKVTILPILCVGSTLVN